MIKLDGLKSLVRKNELRPALYDTLGSNYFIRDNTLFAAKGIRAVTPAGRSKMRTTGEKTDILMTPPGRRMVKDRANLHTKVQAYVKNNFSENKQLYDNLMKMVANRSYLVPRSIASVKDTTIKVDWLPYDINYKGIVNHVAAYAQKPEVNTESDMFHQYEKAIDEVAWELPRAISYDSILRSPDWINKIKLGTNKGYPSWDHMDPEGREEAVKKHRHYLDEVKVPAKLIYTLFYRTQPAKMRAVCGGSEILKVLGGFMTYATTSTIGPDDRVAWGGVGEIFGRIEKYFKVSQTVVSLDFTKLDTTILHRIYQLALITLGENWGRDDPNWKSYMNTYAESVTTNAYLFTHPGHMMPVHTGLLSGTPDTQLVDSMVVLAVTKMLEAFGFNIKYVMALGDDLIILLDDEWDVTWTAKLKAFGEMLLKHTGLIINVDKSFPSLVNEQGYGIFLQYLVTLMGMFGHPIRRLHSFGFIERDSSMIKGVDTQAVIKDHGAKMAYLIRSIQIFATLTENLPGIEEFFELWAYYERDFTSESIANALDVQTDYVVEVPESIMTIAPHHVLKVAEAVGV